MCRYAQFTLSSRQLNYRGFPLIFLNVQQDFRSVYAGEKVMYLIKINGSHMDGQRSRLEIPGIHLMQMQQETNPEKMLNIICRNLHP